MKKATGVSLLVGLVFCASLAVAGSNINGQAWLAFTNNYNTPVTNLASMPAATQYVYVQLGQIVSLAGCEFELHWLPCGEEFSGCYEYSSGTHPSGSGTSCSWLMRGTQVEGMNETGKYEETGIGYWKVAFAGDLCNTVCTKGNVARVLYDFSMCEMDMPGRFCLLYVKVTDCAAVLDILAVIGGATILDGEGVLDPCEVVSTEPATWGGIKALYR